MRLVVRTERDRELQCSPSTTAGALLEQLPERPGCSWRLVHNDQELQTGTTLRDAGAEDGGSVVALSIAAPPPAPMAEPSSAITYDDIRKAVLLEATRKGMDVAQIQASERMPPAYRRRGHEFRLALRDELGNPLGGEQLGPQLMELVAALENLWGLSGAAQQQQQQQQQRQQQGVGHVGLAQAVGQAGGQAGPQAHGQAADQAQGAQAQQQRQGPSLLFSDEAMRTLEAEMRAALGNSLRVLQEAADQEAPEAGVRGPDMAGAAAGAAAAGASGAARAFGAARRLPQAAPMAAAAAAADEREWEEGPVVAPPVSVELVAQLQEMGFSEAVVNKALVLTRNNLGAALEWLLQNGEAANASQPPTQQELRRVYGPGPRVRRGGASSAAANTAPAAAAAAGSAAVPLPPVAAPQRRSTPAERAAAMAQPIVDMGFDPDRARDAVLRYGSVELALTYLLAQQQEEEEEEHEAASSSSEHSHEHTGDEGAGSAEDDHDHQGEEEDEEEDEDEEGAEGEGGEEGHEEEDQLDGDEIDVDMANLTVAEITSILQRFADTAAALEGQQPADGH